MTDQPTPYEKALGDALSTGKADLGDGITVDFTQPSEPELIHWYSPEGATHAVHDVTDWHGTVDRDLVTCPTCLEHLRPKVAGVRLNDRPVVHVRQVGSLRPKTRCGNVLRAPNKIEDIPDVSALPDTIKRCRLCFAGSSR